MNPETLLVPLVIGLVEVVKRVGLESRWLPLVALALSVGIGYLIGVDWVQGLVLALTSMGLWSGTKAVAGL